MDDHHSSPTPPPQSRRPNPAYRQALERLNRALSENTLSDDLEKIDAVRRILFGAENIEATDRSAEEAQKMREESSC
jgi:hypothetical protein